MQLIEFKTIMESLGVPVNGRDASFLGVNIKLISKKDDDDAIGVEIDKLPESIKTNLYDSLCCHYSMDMPGYYEINDRDAFIQVILELAKIGQNDRSCYHLLRHGDLCNMETMRSDINTSLFDIIGRGVKTSEQWCKEQDVKYPVALDLTEEDIMLKELLAQFDELVNPFASDNYRVLMPSSYSSQYHVMFKREYGNILRLSFGDMPENFDPEHISYQIETVDTACSFFTKYTDMSSPSHPDEEDSFTPYLMFNYYYDNPYSETNRRMSIYHAYDKYDEELVISGLGGDTLRVHVNKSTKYNYFAARDKKEAFKALQLAIEELKKTYVGSICTPIVNKRMVAQPISH